MKSAAAVSIPAAKYGTRKRSFGEWMFDSGSPKPLRIVSIPFSVSAGMSGIEPPTRVRSGRVPSACSNASSRELDRRRVGADETGFEPAQSISSSAPSGAASRSSRSAAAPTVSTSWPGARRIENSAEAATLSVVLRMPGLPPRIPFTSADGSAQVRT